MLPLLYVLLQPPRVLLRGWGYNQLGSRATHTRGAYTEARRHNAANEVTAVAGVSTTVAHGAAGNVIRMPVYLADRPIVGGLGERAAEVAVYREPVEGVVDHGRVSWTGRGTTVSQAALSRVRRLAVRWRVMARKGTTSAKKVTAAAIGGGTGGGADFTGDERIVVVHGKEQMLRRTVVEAFRRSLEDKHGPFETYVYDGEQAALAEVLDELRAYSLMQRFKLVVVDHADKFLTNHRDAMTRYAEGPVDHAALLLRSDTWRPGNFDKRVAKHGQVVKCDVASERDAAKWLVQRAKTKHAAELKPAAADRLVERLGAELMRLDSELGKLALLAGDEPITRALVDETVGRESDEQVWAAQEAVLKTLVTGDARPALTMIDELIRVARHDPVPVTYFVADVARKLAVAEAMRRSGMNDFAIGKALKLWPRERQELFTQAMRKLRPGEAGDLQRRVLAVDVRTKSGLGQGLRNLECFCVSLADCV